MLTSNAQLFWDTSFLHTALMSSLRQSMTQGSLRTMKSKLDVFPRFVFILAHVLSRKIGSKSLILNLQVCMSKKYISIMVILFYVLVFQAGFDTLF